MIILYILLGLLAVILLLLIIPVRMKILFRQYLMIKIYVWGIPIQLFPAKEKLKKEVPKKVQKSQVKKAEEETKSFFHDFEQMLKEDGFAATCHYYKEIMSLLGKASKQILNAIVVDRYQLALHIVGEDAADTAIRYGQLCGVVYPIQAVVESQIKVKKRKLDFKADFNGSKTTIQLELVAHAMPLRLLIIAAKTFFQFITHHANAVDKKG